MSTEDTQNVDLKPKYFTIIHLHIGYLGFFEKKKHIGSFREYAIMKKDFIVN